MEKGVKWKRERDKMREREGKRACKRRRWSMPTCVSKNHNFYLWAEIGLQAG